jgi:intracellular septation protein A
MVAVLIMCVMLTGTLCVLAYRFAVHALPIVLGFQIAHVVFGTGAGLIGAGIVGLVSGAVAFGLLSVIFVSVKSPIVRVIIGLVFALPAAGAGYALMAGMTASAVPSEIWRQIFCIVGAVLVGAAAFTPLAVPAQARLA